MGIIMYDDVPYGANNPDFLAPTPSIYSEDEEQVGIDENGKPIYQKTFVPSTPFSIQSGSGWYTTGITITNLDRIITTHSLTANNGCMDGWMNYLNYNNSGTIYASHSRSSAVSIAVFTIQYTKTTDTAWQGGFKAYGFSPVIYSDTEREIGVWRDGKPLYQKVVNYGALPNASGSVNKAHNIANVDNIFIAGGYFVETSGSDKYYYPLVLASGSNEYNIYTRVDKTNIRVSVNRDRSSMTAIVVVQYTKTTDVAGSGKYTTLGTPSVHYDGEERVIGTWFGETLYQKTIDFGAMPNNTTKSVAHGISNIKRVVSIDGYSFNSTAGNLTVPLPFVSTSALASQMDIRCDFTNVTVITGTGRQNFAESFVTLRYTKTS